MLIEISLLGQRLAFVDPHQTAEGVLPPTPRNPLTHPTRGYGGGGADKGRFFKERHFEIPFAILPVLHQLFPEQLAMALAKSDLKAAGHG